MELDLNDIRTRNWCFTINNPTDQDFEACIGAVEAGVCQYLVFGFERAPTTGTPHIQGYLECKGPKSLRALKRQISNRAKFLIRNGSAERAAVYCVQCDVCGDIKNNCETCENCPFAHEPGFDPEIGFQIGDWFEAGGPSPLSNEPLEDGTVPRGQGKRNDINRVRECVKNGGTIHDVLEIAGSYQAAKFGQLLLEHRPTPKRELPAIIWLWGPTGTGKSARARSIAAKLTGGEEGEPDGYWFSSRGLEWWHEYRGQKVVVLDDFRGDFCKFHHLIRILDRYPYRVDVKHSSQALLAHTVIITSAFPPEQTYRNVGEQIGQLTRRIHIVKHLTEVLPPPQEDPAMAAAREKRLSIARELIDMSNETFSRVLAAENALSVCTEVEGNTIGHGDPPANAPLTGRPPADEPRPAPIGANSRPDNLAGPSTEDLISPDEVANIDDTEALRDIIYELLGAPATQKLAEEIPVAALPVTANLLAFPSRSEITAARSRKPPA